MTVFTFVIMLVLISTVGKIFADRNTNALVIVDRPEIVDRIEKMIKKLDQPRETKSFVLENATAASVLTKIQPFLSAASRTQLDIEGNRILVQESASGMEEIAFLIAEFDRPTLLETRFFELSHALPEAVLSAVTPELTPDLGKVVSDEKTNTIIFPWY